MAAPLDLQYFQQAGDIYSRLRGNEARMLQQMAQSNQVSPDMQMLMEEEAKFKLREQQKEAYAKWEREQILNQAAQSRLEDIMASGESMPSMLAAQQKAAAQEALRRGKPEYAREFMANYQQMADAEAKRKQAEEKNRLETQQAEEKLKQAKRDSASANVIQTTNAAGDVIFIDKGTMEVIKTVKGAGKPSSAWEKAQQDLTEGQKDLDDALTTLRGYYLTLDEKQAIVNPDRSALSNIGASISASAPGQIVGGMVGTESQTIRDSINMQRPLLLQAIKNATGMTAKQMDSNAELKLWLSSATDPTLSIKANLAALDSIERKYLKKSKDDSEQVKEDVGAGKVMNAPAAAIEYLMAHPETKDQFKAKFGFLPEGM